MIDVSGKPTTWRRAVARAFLSAGPATVERVRSEAVPKGNALETARAAGILAAKRTAELIPLCHPVPLDHVSVEFLVEPGGILVTASAIAVWRTGVEMEALVAASVAALTLYDMLKPLDGDMEIRSVKLVEKRGGTSDLAGSFPHELRAAVVVTSDRAAAGEREDTTGPAILEALRVHGLTPVEYRVVPDDRSVIEALLRRLSDGEGCDLILTTGGTGPGPRDLTVEAAHAVVERDMPGIMEAARGFGQSRTPYAMLSRGTAGLRGKTLIVTLPGSERGVRESLAALLPGLLHAFPMMDGQGHAE